MKMNKRAIFAALVVGLLALGSSSANALTESQTASLTKTLASVPPVELAPRAVQLVNKADKADKLDTGLLIVKTVAKRNPAAAVSVFSAITAVAPELAVKLAAAVVELLPEKSAAVARIAAQNDPKNSSKVVEAMVKVAPAQAESIVQSANTVKAVADVDSSSATTLVNDNTTRSFPPGQRPIIYFFRPFPINPRLTFPNRPPRDVSGYAASGFDPNRP